MKTGIHPNYQEATIICSCGEVIHTRSTKPSMRVEICSKCHPFLAASRGWWIPPEGWISI